MGAVIERHLWKEKTLLYLYGLTAFGAIDCCFSPISQGIKCDYFMGLHVGTWISRFRKRTHRIMLPIRILASLTLGPYKYILECFGGLDLHLANHLLQIYLQRLVLDADLCYSPQRYRLGPLDVFA